MKTKSYTLEARGKELMADLLVEFMLNEFDFDMPLTAADDIVDEMAAAYEEVTAEEAP